jgi:hypothetical protein
MFKKGYTPWNKGKKATIEHRMNISEGIKSHLPSSAYRKGHIQLNGYKKGNIPWSKTHKLLMPRGKNHSQWNGGKVYKIRYIVQNCNLRISRFCSLKCKSRYFSKAFSGKGHPQWTGGKMIDKDGYLLVYSPSHPFRSKKKYIREHRIIMEKFLSRYLTKEEIVHHIDGNRLNNNISNLMLFSSNSQHRLFHLNKKLLTTSNSCA